MAKQTLAQIADELYGLAPAEFTAARNARAKDIKDTADAELAKRVTELRKPSPAAWAVNLLAREHAAEVAQLADLGAAMREAQEELDRDQLAEFTRQRRALVNALARQASALATAARHNLTASVTEEVAQTLQAALNDPAVAAPEASMMSAPRPQAKTAPVRDLAAVRAAKEAEKRADEADAAVRGLERDLEQRETARERLESRFADLEQQVATVENELRDTDRDLRTLGRDRDKAARRAADLRAEAEKLRSEN